MPITGEAGYAGVFYYGIDIIGDKDIVEGVGIDKKAEANEDKVYTFFIINLDPWIYILHRPRGYRLCNPIKFKLRLKHVLIPEPKSNP